ncbi:Fc.00g103950.m01.CDS01 [Cosmosporella sp. VM-42]
MMDLPTQAWISPLPSLSSAVNWNSTGSSVQDKEDNSFGSGSPHSPASNCGFKFPFENRLEARYLMHYIKDLASWIDICDPARSFSTEVPKRACKLPLLSYSILAFSSRHLYLMTGREDPNCETYYNQAVQILIPTLDAPLETLDENVLAGIILLRLYEEISDADTGTHLLGSSRLLNTVSSFAAQGGLGEAASWIVLRQDIYVSLTRWQPLRISVDNYKNSNAFRDTNDEAMANRAIFLCGQVLDYAQRTDTHLNHDMWAELNNNLLEWYESVPWRRVGPYFLEAATPQNDNGDVFPNLWMTQSTHVLGYQHFYLARLLLIVFDPQVWKPGFEALKNRTDIDDAVLTNLRMIIGLAISNPTVITAVFTAHHILFTCKSKYLPHTKSKLTQMRTLGGSYLKDSRERTAVFQFLRDMTKSIGWRTKPLADKLSREWS